MPLTKTLAVVEAVVFTPPGEDAKPEHPIYIPVEPPPESGLSPEHPIYFPVYPAHPIELPPEGGTQPPGIWPAPGVPAHPIYVPVPPPTGDVRPEHPIYWPVYPEHPIVLPPEGGLSEEQKEALRAFLFGNLPPAAVPHF
jgi:hypothetical protein